MLDRKSKITSLLKAIETGDDAGIAVINPDKYIQHNPQTHEGGEGLAALFKRLAKLEPKVAIVRIFEDGDYVFAHTEYDFDTVRIGFEVFRFEGEQTVEHWDNIQPQMGPNPSGHTMLGGETSVLDLDNTEINRQRVTSFVQNVLIARDPDRLPDFIDARSFIEHDPGLSDDLSGLRDALSVAQGQDESITRYATLHRVLAQGNFVLSVSEGFRHRDHVAYYDLFRLQDEMIVEHWDTTETVAPPDEWKNDNGKF
ncbi:MAG: nuclear transport factor 2 family protein [Pseudomonadota bacterium]